ncbi:tail fiber domain-containing protein [Halobacteriovorax sp. ZH4_bin.1]|uniref:tail fiber domain-containing protein n=1 Tax=unclassified Halobacteriovorax TaxID=2639665 RepID=UPI003713F3FC
MYVSRIFTFILAFSLSFLSLNLHASTSKLGYSGRLVQSNGTPITGTPNLKFDLFYSNDLATVVATQTINSVPLSNGIYTVELDFDNLGSFDPLYSSTADVIDKIPSGQTLVIRVTDITDVGNPIAYDYQNILANPISVYANHSAMADNLVIAAACSPGQVVSVNASNKLECVDQTAAVAVDTTLVDNAGVIGQANIGSAGTYTSVTVDNFGRVTSGSSPEVDSSGIQDGSIMDADINAAAAISWSKINAPTIDKTYVGLGNLANVAQIPASDLDNSGTLDSATQVPSELAVKGYVDTTAQSMADAKVINSMAGTETDTAPSVDSVKNYVTAQTGAITSSQWTDSGLDIYFSTGHVGIGTSSPTGPLHIVGGANDVNTMRFGATDADVAAITDYANMAGLLIASEGVSNSYHSLRVVSDIDGTDIESLAVTNAGRVGIGVLNPTSKLEVAGNIKGTGLCIGADCRTAWPTGNAGTVTSVTGGTGLTGGTITSSGTLAVDVGTTNGKIAQVGAGDKLADSIINYNPAIDVALTGFTTGAASSVLATDTVLQAFQKVQGQLNSHASNIAAISAYDTDDISEGSTNLYHTDARAKAAAVVNSTVGSETDQAPSVAAIKSYVDNRATQWTTAGSDIHYSTGKVGININAPTSQLHIKEVDDTWASSFRMDRSWDSTTDYFQMMYDYQGLKIRTMANDADEAHIIFKPLNSEAMRITESGNVGIGIDTPTEKLDVAGKVKATELCISADCRASWPTGNAGTVTAVTGGTGLTGGTITSSGTLAVDVGTTNGKIAQVGAGDKLADSIINYNPAIDVALTGFTTGAASSVLATDTVLQAFQKVQGQLDSHASSLASISAYDTDDILEGSTNLYHTDARAKTAAVVNSTVGSETDQAPSVAAIKSYVDNRATQWTTTGSDIHYPTGNIGIGVTTPYSLLDINGVDKTVSLAAGRDFPAMLRLNSTDPAIGAESNILFTSNYSGSSKVANASIASIQETDGADADYGQASLVFRTSGSLIADLNKERMRINGAGNVGIGVASPGHKLTVNGGANFATASGTQPFYISRAGATTEAFSLTVGDTASFFDLIEDNGEPDFQDMNFRLIYEGGDTHTYLRTFATGPNAGDVDVYLQSSGGNVAIGNIAPTQKLTIDGGMNVTTGNDICIDGVGCLSGVVAASGEQNTASSAGGTSLYKTKTGTDLVFKGLTASSDLTLTANTDDVNIAVNTSNGANELLRLDGSGRVPASNVMSTPLTGYSVGANSVLAATDTILDAYGKLQAQINANYTAITGLANTDDLAEGATNLYFTNGRAQSAAVVNSTAGTETVQAPSVSAMKNYVTTEIAGVNQSQWTTSGSNIYYNSGNVGIGTATPQNQLHVSGALNSYIYLEDRSGGADNKIWSFNNNDGVLYLGQRNDDASYKNTHMTITPTGNVGIGDTSPTSKLMIRGNDDAITGPNITLSGDAINQFEGGRIRFTEANGTFQGGFIHYDGTGPDYLHIGVHETADSNILNDVNSISIRRNNGNVGIGISAATEKLHVAGNVLAAAYLYTSDERFKENVETIIDPLHKVKSLRGVTFDWKTDKFPERNFPKEKTVGFIAQEVEKVQPELVKTGQDGYKSVQYGNITALLVEAVKSISNKVEELFSNDEEVKREIASLKEENEQLKAEMQEMRQAIKELQKANKK